MENWDLALDLLSEGKWWREKVGMGEKKAQKCVFCRCLLCSKNMIQQMKL